MGTFEGKHKSRQYSEATLLLVILPASPEQRGNNSNGFDDFYLKAKDMNVSYVPFFLDSGSSRKPPSSW